jgi:hypothetical protein
VSGAERDARSGRRGAPRIARELFGAGGDSVWIQPPFHCDYGSNIELGERVFFNFDCVVLDVCRVRVGDFTLFGPAVQIYTATHPLDAELRRTVELGKPSDPRAHRLAQRPRPTTDQAADSGWIELSNTPGDSNTLVSWLREVVALGQAA